MTTPLRALGPQQRRTYFDPLTASAHADDLRDSDARYSLYLDSALMARADGSVRDEEFGRLDELRSLLGITEDQAVALCNLAIAILVLDEGRTPRAHAVRQLHMAEARALGEGIPTTSLQHPRRPVEI